MITHLRLTQWMTFHEQSLELGSAALLVGPHHVGKTNALLALRTLGRLAAGWPIESVLEDLECAPRGQNEFRIGCSVGNLTYDITVEVRPELRITEEVLGMGEGESLNLAELSFDGRHSALFKLAGLPVNEDWAIEELSETLRSITEFVPQPEKMREFSPVSSVLESDASNLSGVLYQLASTDPESFARIETIACDLGGPSARSVGFATTDLGDVMLVLNEQFQGQFVGTPARHLSDGFLGELALATAQLSGKTLLIDTPEHFLHPQHSDLFLAMLHGIQSIVATRSPALVDAGQEVGNEHIVIVGRDPDTGLTYLNPIVDIEEIDETEEPERNEENEESTAHGDVEDVEKGEEVAETQPREETESHNEPESDQDSEDDDNEGAANTEGKESVMSN
ncbi:AAA family ATPase [Corynebacterium freiburgense]|uniref:AAA family ATPase n=1 Tax=Corynebacterium freiburgense TaxID=556548 RepID=UPI00047A3526|nr:hypothetical protein [Corynebacterium freiburgense]